MFSTIHKITEQSNKPKEHPQQPETKTVAKHAMSEVCLLPRPSYSRGRAYKAQSQHKHFMKNRFSKSVRNTVAKTPEARAKAFSQRTAVRLTLHFIYLTYIIHISYVLYLHHLHLLYRFLHHLLWIYIYIYTIIIIITITIIIIIITYICLTYIIYTTYTFSINLIYMTCFIYNLQYIHCLHHHLHHYILYITHITYIFCTIFPTSS